MSYESETEAILRGYLPMPIRPVDLPAELSDDGQIIYCSACPNTLATTFDGWLEHHDDGSHTVIAKRS